MSGRRNATTRLVAAHFLAVALSTGLVLGLVFWSTRSLIQAEVREVVQAEVAGLEEGYRAGGLRGLAEAIERRAGDPGNRDGVYLLTDANGHRITGNLAEWPTGTLAGTGWVGLRLHRTDVDREAQVAAAALRLEGGERLLVGRDARARVQFEERLVTALWWALALMALLALATGWLLSRLVLRRIGDVAETAREIVEGQFDRRVPLRGSGDEFDRLGAALNKMLDRIEGLVGDLRMVTDSVAHDLRSPLTRLRGAIELASREDVDEATRDVLLARALEEADQTLRMLTGLMEIARAEAGVGRDQFERVDLGRLADDVVELFGPVSEERGVALERAGAGGSVGGHAQLLAQALANLVENALIHAPEGSRVTVGAGGGAAAPRLWVADRGPGVPEADRERILRRFVRLDASRKGPGTGLGLSLVAAIARLHGATLDLSDNAPGLVVTLAFAQPAAENAGASQKRAAPPSDGLPTD